MQIPLMMLTCFFINTCLTNAAEEPFSKEEQALFDHGKEVYELVCISCHGEDGMGVKNEIDGKIVYLAAPIAGSKHITNPKETGRAIRAILQGMTGPVDGKVYGGLMAPMEGFDDDWLAAVLTYIRNAWGNKAPVVFPKDFAKVREETKGRKTAWTEEELKALINKK